MQSYERGEPSKKALASYESRDKGPKKLSAVPLLLPRRITQSHRAATQATSAPKNGVMRNTVTCVTRPSLLGRCPFGRLLREDLRLRAGTVLHQPTALFAQAAQGTFPVKAFLLYCTSLYRGIQNVVNGKYY
jgi:hypothetical protein